MVSRLMSWLRGEDLEPRLDRLNAPLPISVREAAGEQIVRWERGRPGYTDKSIHAYDRDAYRKGSLIFACVQYMANAAGSVPARVYKQLPNGQDEEDARHPLRQLLESPNVGMGDSRFIAFVTMVATVAGFCVIEKERDQYGRVIGLWPLRPDWLRPVPRSAGIVDWQYTVPGYAEPFLVPHEDAIAIPYGDVPTNDPMGIGPVEVIFREAGISGALTDFIARFIENDAMPQFMLIPDMEGKLSAQWQRQETVDAFYAQFKQRYMGRGRERDIIVSPAIKGVERLTMNMNELAYPDLRSVNDASITTAFGIPPILLQTLYGLEHATYSNYAQARRAFWEDKLVPWLARLDDAFTRHLMPEFWPNEGHDLRFDLSDVPAMKEDENAAHERARQDFATGLVSRHSAQRMAGIDPHGEDVFLQPYSAIAVPNSGQRGIQATVGPIEATGRVYISPGVQVHGSNGFVLPGRRYATTEQRRAGQQVARKNKQTVAQLAKVAEPLVRGFFDEQRDRIIAAVAGQRSGRVLESRAVEQVDWLSEDEFFREAFRGWWEEVTGEAFTDISKLLGVDIDLEGGYNPQLEELYDVLGERVTQINETTKQAVETVVRESLIDGASIDDLANNLRDLFDETYANRHITVARTESQVAFNLASQRAYQASGIVDEVQMHDGVDCEAKAGSDGLTCPERNGMLVPVSDMPKHIEAEHPQGTLAFSPVVPGLTEAE